MDINWDSIELTKELKKQSLDLYEYVYNSCIRAANVCEEIKEVFKEYTDHSFKHSYAVLKTGDELAKNIPLNKWEISIFILSCYYHDIGMHITETEKVEIMSQPAYKKTASFLREQIAIDNQLPSNDPELIETFLFLEYIRRCHAIRSRKWINENFSKENKDAFINEVYLWEKVALVSEAHGMDINNIAPPQYFIDDSLGNPDEKINTIFLACLLRLSDYCHMNQNRALPYLRLAKDFYSKKSEDIWKKLANIDYVICNNEKRKIEVKASFDDYRLHRATLKECEDIDMELRNQLKWLSKHSSPYEYQVYYVDTERVSIKQDADYRDISSSFKMDYSKVTRLLIGSKLYRDSLYALRECIQNSLDAISAYRLKNSRHQGQITIQIHTNHEGSQIVEIFDNGTGMNSKIVDNYFLSIGSKSYWRTEDFNNDWGSVDDTSIIASHGIGVLSYFLIADKIDVYSKYPDNPYVHVLIDGYEANVVYLSTKADDFPKVSMDIATPWDDGHGTCIQMRLKESINPAEIIYFLLRNVVRVSPEVNLVIDGKQYALQPRWNFTPMDEPSARRYLDTVNKDIEFIFKEFHKSNDPYALHPPHDKSLNVEISLPEIRGTAHLTPYNQHGREKNRVTQNGILIEDASDFIDSFIPELFRVNGRNVATYDINVEGKAIFDLDAERTRILDTDSNRAIGEKIKTQLIDNVIKSISQIENTLYFPCGNAWYHTFSNGLEDIDNCEIAFHESLNILLNSLSLLREDKRRLFFGAFGKARLYCVLQEKGNSAISAYELINDKTAILMMPKNMDMHNGNPFGFDTKRCNPNDMLEFSKSKELKAVILPNYFDAFSFPLLDRANLEIIVNNEKFVGYTLRSANTPDSYIKNLTKICSDVAPKRNKAMFDVRTLRHHGVEIISSDTTLADDINLLDKFLTEI